MHRGRSQCTVDRVTYDAVVVGSGPNGLAAATVLAQAGCSVLVLEGAQQPGGGARTAELTLAGFRHDVCSAIHPLGIASPLFRTLPLAQHGLAWIHAPAPLAHPFLDGRVALLERDLATTATQLGDDADAYADLLQPFLRRWHALLDDALAPLRFPHHPLLYARFGLAGLRSAESVMRTRFRTDAARALFGGIASHAFLPLSVRPTAAFGLMLALAAHAEGWPLARGGSQSIVQALIGHLATLGAKVETGTPVRSLAELPAAKIVMLDLTPRQLLTLAGDQLPPRYRRALERYRYGPAAFKVDWALAGPIPWRSPQCARAATLHLIGSSDEVLAASGAAWRAEHREYPLVLLAQPTLFDASRAPAGKHVAWAYCHVPHGSTVDMTARIEGQIERFAPGFRELILGRSVLPPAELERHNPNLVGGDINGGVQDLRQLFTRPVRRRVPYATPLKGVYLCSASTPPGGGVHGMCGYNAAKAALRGAGFP
ncbi:MAG TPA: NAD(P)/FAD-dependent oxidoreductase [Gemmatimonadales bacterium]|nr:NAD(P)/FAD-dependent oxidoreductase [Gemmatimonadales bacterium]